MSNDSGEPDRHRRPRKAGGFRAPYPAPHIVAAAGGYTVNPNRADPD